jgi:Fe2+ transport system protein FeoA
MSFAHLAFSSNGVRSLATLAEGIRAVVVGVDDRDERRVDRLVALGVTAGAKVTVLQTFPGIVFLCDQTELAVEWGVAGTILVRPVEG